MLQALSYPHHKLLHCVTVCQYHNIQLPKPPFALKTREWNSEVLECPLEEVGAKAPTSKVSHKSIWA